MEVVWIKSFTLKHFLCMKNMLRTISQHKIQTFNEGVERIYPLKRTRNGVKSLQGFLLHGNE